MYAGGKYPWALINTFGSELRQKRTEAKILPFKLVSQRVSTFGVVILPRRLHVISKLQARKRNSALFWILFLLLKTPLLRVINNQAKPRIFNYNFPTVRNKALNFGTYLKKILTYFVHVMRREKHKKLVDKRLVIFDFPSQSKDKDKL